MRQLVALVRNNMGYTYEATKLGKSQAKLPNGTKVKMDTNKGLMLSKKGIVIKLSRKELTNLLRAAKKRMRIA